MVTLCPNGFNDGLSVLGKDKVLGQECRAAKYDVSGAFLHKEKVSLTQFFIYFISFDKVNIIRRANIMLSITLWVFHWHIANISNLFYPNKSCLSLVLACTLPLI